MVTVNARLDVPLLPSGVLALAIDNVADWVLAAALVSDVGA
ncbi:MAG: hypothetical protein ACOYB7_11875 [Mycobacterium sp.]